MAAAKKATKKTKAVTKAPTKKKGPVRKAQVVKGGCTAPTTPAV